MVKMKTYALAYAEEFGIAIIPLHNIKDGKCTCYKGEACGKSAGKHPRFPEWEKKWSKDPKVINDWWDTFPDANIGMVTGKASNGICVIDVDAQIGKDNLKEHINGTVSPVAKTARTDFDGEHWYFRTDENIPDNIKAIKGLDFRNNGLIVLPPSQGLAKRYEWKNKISQHEIPTLPESLRLALTQSKSLSANDSDQELKEGSSLMKPNDYIRNVYNVILETLNVKGLITNSNRGDVSQSVTIPTDFFIEGQRESDLFSLANDLVKCGRDLNYIREVLARVMFTCHDVDPTFIESKIKNASKRHGLSNNATLSKKIEEYVTDTQGIFIVTDCYRDLGIVTTCDKATCRTHLSRLVKKNVIERVGGKSGQYRRVENQIVKMDWKNAKAGNYYDLKMPLGLHEKMKLHPKGIMVIAGSQNAGKTAFVMTMALINKEHNVSYYNSEMGEEELADRISKFEHVQDDWNHVSFFERNTNFHDVIDPNGLNIIDFMEMNDNFYLVGEKIRQIHDKLDKGCCVICLQKKKGQELGRGSEFSLEKPRIYLSMDFQMIKVIKCKTSVHENMNDKEIPFKLVNGTNFIQTEGSYDE